MPSLVALARVRTWLLTAAALVAAVALACSSDAADPVPGASTLDEAANRGRFGVGVTTLELVDSSRPTEPNGDFPGAEDRALTVEVWYPADPAAQAPEQIDAEIDAGEAPYPLIVFAHGFSSGRRQSASYAQHLASHGYVVASPDFPLSTINAPGGPSVAAVVEQPGDVSFVIDSLLELSATRGDRFEGMVYGEAVGVTGHSLGGLTALLTAYGTSRDERLRAVLPIAGPGCFLAEDTVGDVLVPMMALGGSIDQLVDRGSVRRAFDLANPPRYHVELIGADHTRFADVDLTDTQVLELLPGLIGGERTADEASSVSDAVGTELEACSEQPSLPDDSLIMAERQRELLRTFATPFFDAFLRDSDEARAFLEEELPALLAADARTEFDP